MPDFAISNITLPAHDHCGYFPALADMGFTGLEVAPSRAWPDTWGGLGHADVETYRKAAETAGLSVTGLHSLFFDQPALSLFGDPETRKRTGDFLVHLSSLCRDLGGRVLVFGSPSARRRGPLSEAQAADMAVDFFQDCLDRIRDHRTLLCLEPLCPTDTDFCNSIASILNLRDRVGRSNMRTQIDARAVTANGDVTDTAFDAVRDTLVHVHANARDLGELTASDGDDNARIGHQLKRIGYKGFVSLEQRMIGDDDPLAAVARSLQVMEKAYR